MLIDHGVVMVALGLLGMVLGSFASAIIWRIHGNKKISGLHTRSMCPKCRHKLGFFDLIPILSWLALGGKCRYCQRPISYSYPLVELLMAIIFVLSYLSWDFSNNAISYLQLGIWLAAVVCLVILAVYDLRWMILPDKIQLPLLGLAFVHVALITVNSSSYLDWALPILGSIVFGGLFFGLFALSGGKWMGGGDFKLVISLSLLLGLSKTILMMVLAFNVAALVSLLLIGFKVRTRRDLIPFGPFLIGAAIIAQLGGDYLIHLYLRFTGLA